ncbi:MAG: flagellar basal body P-ring formation chaperone FlgA [Pseudomonadota bacterium]
MAVACLLILSGNSCRAAAAPDTEGSLALAAQIRNFIEAQIVPPADTDIEIGLEALKTLPYSTCAKPLDVRLYTPRPGIGNTSVALNCPQDLPWRAILPVTIRGYAAVVVANRPLLPGQTVRAEDLQQVKLDIANLHNGYYTQSIQVINALVKQAIRPGMPVYAHQLRPALLIKRGEKVVLMREHSGLSIRMMGEALKDGALGDIIPVRNLNSRRVVEGTVTRRQEVTIRM